MDRKDLSCWFFMFWRWRGDEYSSVLYCTETELNCTAPYCIVLCTILVFAVFYFTALNCTALHCTAMDCISLQWTALHCTALHCTALHCNALHSTALHCTALYWCGGFISRFIYFFTVVYRIRKVREGRFIFTYIIFCSVIFQSQCMAICPQDI